MPFFPLEPRPLKMSVHVPAWSSSGNIMAVKLKDWRDALHIQGEQVILFPFKVLVTFCLVGIV